jgi:hypothetical protein
VYGPVEFEYPARLPLDIPPAELYRIEVWRVRRQGASPSAIATTATSYILGGLDTRFNFTVEVGGDHQLRPLRFSANGQGMADGLTRYP